MKNIPEDDLIRIAFGEASEEEAQRLLAGADPGSAMKLDLYRRLCADLRGMASDVPEPQLSQERLQEAILRAGLKRERRAWSWTWAFAPVAALAIGVLFINRRPDLVEPVQPNRETIEAPEAATQGPVAPAPKTSPGPAVAEVRPSGAPVAPVAAPKRYVRLGGAARNKSTIPVTGGLAADAMRNLAFLGASKRSAPELASRGDAAPRAGSSDPARTSVDAAAPADAMIVLIASETDAATGANLAIEVASTSNVVIGS
ncbi:MAG: hypothetical protein KIS66_02900 [Fimbriimonadaceae bacterium]|nr:hypothetical protein [Fimbriimonadaceae bacterium]